MFSLSLCFCIRSGFSHTPWKLFQSLGFCSSRVLRAGGLGHSPFLREPPDSWASVSAVSVSSATLLAFLLTLKGFVLCTRRLGFSLFLFFLILCVCVHWKCLKESRRRWRWQVVELFLKLDLLFSLLREKPCAVRGLFTLLPGLRTLKPVLSFSCF